MTDTEHPYPGFDPEVVLDSETFGIDSRNWLLAGSKDTVLLDAPGQLLITFTQPATREFPFMFQCHILEHEDGGMMGSTSRSEALA